MPSLLRRPKENAFVSQSEVVVMDNAADADKAICFLSATSSITTTAPTPNPPLLSLDAKENIFKIFRNAIPHPTFSYSETKKSTWIGNQRSTGAGKHFQTPDAGARFCYCRLRDVGLIIHLFRYPLYQSNRCLSFTPSTQNRSILRLPRFERFGLNAAAINNTISDRTRETVWWQKWRVSMENDDRERGGKTRVTGVGTLVANHY
ncbi:hypothetical protein PQX77_001264 [Marasmius sp. AFHP31]|nr:hypothetical protein PQX77_001264 [Marasmius sp. AFHP31]